jgi:hypothetical protein
MTQKQRKLFYPITFFLGAIPIVFGYKYFEYVIIDLSVPIGMTLAVGITALIVDSKNNKKTCDYIIV